MTIYLVEAFMKPNEFIKRRGVYLFSLFLLSVLYALIIPNTIFAVFCFLLSFSLSFYSFYTYEKKAFSFEKEISSYSFFSSFLNSLMAQIPTKQSYEFALQYLLSYQEEVPYESIKENRAFLLSILSNHILKESSRRTKRGSSSF